jgi:hypothetical protein
MSRRAHIATRTRVGSLLATGCLALMMAAILPGTALASFSESYGGGSLCGSNCYIQSAGSHTFILNEGSSTAGSPALACQLFNSKGANEVSHGNGFCEVFYFGGAFVAARVYNQSGKTFNVGGFAET